MLQKQEGMILVICYTFCMVDRTVKCYNLALGKIFQNHKMRSVRFISTCVFVLFSKVLVLCFIYATAKMEAKSKAETTNTTNKSIHENTNTKEK